MNDRLIEALRASLENFSQDTRADRTEYARLRAVLVLAIAERDAAPDLLEALVELLEHEGQRVVNGIGLEADSDELRAVKEQARAALAKARA